MSAGGDGAELRAILDVSAMLSYARAHVHVGELVIEIAEDGAFVGLPAVTLLDAYARLLGDKPGQARLGLLATLPGVRVLSLSAADAERVSAFVPLAGGDLARAHAVSEAVAHRVYYFTTEPKAAPTILPREQVHAIPDRDA
jgi:hypothetical protein